MKPPNAIVYASLMPIWGRWFAAICGLLVIISSGHAYAQEPSGPDDMPDLGAGASGHRAIPPAPKDYIHHEVGSTLFVYPRDARSRVEPLVETANEVRRALGDELGHPVLSHVEVRIAPDVAQMATLAPDGLPPPSHAVGVTYARHRLILLSLVSPNRSAPTDLDHVYRHELAHVALFDAVGGCQVPKWFNEGYAVYASAESSLLRTRALWSGTLSEKLLPLSQLDSALRAGGGDESLAYAQSADFVRFLLRTQDRDRFKQFIARVERGEPFDQALGSSYSAPVRTLEREWHDELDERYGYVPVFFGGGLLWVIVFGVLGVGWYRRRKKHARTLMRWEREAAEVVRQKENADEPVVRVTLKPRSVAESVDLAALRKARTRDVPKIEHDGKWHTLH